ncbi:aminoglycoside phosphotransferase family protein [Beggiatoa leptomitoformis]|uniref:Phosphotransferase n=1 Tax=Beggiatoa leptomitoformis TaxID=288004 RepID=A0A2N9YH22_9GAMM|nr:phosphotransferase [Beggiatoa leptomitoformis]ALG68028.1 phosphotransferase [Beggiatoa leptomitoformis]AUI69685.1 phosphotransferase [Beggiatoa leptomitoformis]
MDIRTQQRLSFLAQHGWEHAQIIALPFDASFRRYFRLQQGNSRVLLMDAPPEREDVRPFVQIAQHLCALQLSAPQVLHADSEQGFLLLEDFGDATFTCLLNQGVAPLPLYTNAVDALIALHQHPQAKAIALPAYDTQRLLAEAALLADWFLPAVLGRETTTAIQESYLQCWQTILEALPPPPITLVLRDYHVDNLMQLAERKGVQCCGLLDFQDALLGASPYDLVSLLEDARRDVPDNLSQLLRERYYQAFPQLDRVVFDSWYRVLGVQRHCKVLGIFVRLFKRDGKKQYLQHLPRLLRLLTSGLSAPVLQSLKSWLEQHGIDENLGSNPNFLALLRLGE